MAATSASPSSAASTAVFPRLFQNFSVPNATVAPTTAFPTSFAASPTHFSVSFAACPIHFPASEKAWVKLCQKFSV